MARRSSAVSAAAPVADLGRFCQSLRPYQIAVVNDAIRFHWSRSDLPADAPPEERRILYAQPTGTGKGTEQLALLRQLRTTPAMPDGSAIDAWIVTPSLDVLRGYLERCGAADLGDLSEETLARMGEAIFVTTPQRMMNRILGSKMLVPDVIIYDEVHHAVEQNEVAGTLFALAPLTTFIGFTATPFRGTPQETRELEKAWPEQVTVLTIPQAVENGSWALPTFEVVGIYDDDEVRVAGGDFQAKAAGKLVTSRVSDLARLTQERWFKTSPPIPTSVVVPNTESAGLLVEALDALGVPARFVGQATKAKDRALAYEECRTGRGVLVSIKILGEGVDFPWLGRIIDARPTLSPVSWLQMVGRLTRPKGYRPEYICVCRNMERHAYLLQGLVPRTAVKAAQDAFDGRPSKRSGSRSVGLEALSRFKAIDLPVLGGVKGSMYALYSTDPDTGIVTEWAVLLDPTSERAITARRVNTPGKDGSMAWGRWEAATLPDDLVGYATSGWRGEVTEKQKAWWLRSAAVYGLDPDACRGSRKLQMRQFAALRILWDLGMTLHAESVTA